MDGYTALSSSKYYLFFIISHMSNHRLGNMAADMTNSALALTMTLEHKPPIKYLCPKLQAIDIHHACFLV